VLRLGDKVVLITGAGGGLGRGMALACAREGASVVCQDVREGAARAAAEAVVNAGGRATPHACDVTDGAAVEAMFDAVADELGPVNVLVNNAGILRAIPLPMMSLEDYQSVIDVNQTGVFLGMKSVIPSMIKAGGGSIVNTSSIDGFQGSPALTAYVAAKFAVRGMTRVAALELTAAGIRVNTVCPGATRTRMMDCPDMAGIDIDALASRMAPMGRMGEAREIANATLFLASDESSYITGTDITVDGGTLAGVGVEMFSQVTAAAS
jgi:3alpha(or 20beta)-hydroxysteroid dehydrogenase